MNPVREPGAGRASARVRTEARVRDAWVGTPGLGLLLASGAFAAAHDLRDFLYDTGILRIRRPPIPVISVGGLTAGGSGKTPVAAEVAGWLEAAGWRPALVTAGFPDEMRALAVLVPGVAIEGGRDRLAAVRRAAAAGAGLAVLDSGFQHRALGRSLELVCVDARSWKLPGRRRLPAGPFRERSGALVRADAVVVVVRSDLDEATAVGIEESVLPFAPRAVLASCRLEPRGFRPANGPAGSAHPSPRTVAAAGVMWPEDLFRAVRQLDLAPAAELAFPNHEPFGPARLAALAEAARGGGIVCSLKDAVKLGPLLEDRLPVWYVEEKPRWLRGGEVLRRGLLRLAVTTAGPPAARPAREGRS